MRADSVVQLVNKKQKSETSPPQVAPLADHSDNRFSEGYNPDTPLSHGEMPTNPVIELTPATEPPSGQDSDVPQPVTHVPPPSATDDHVPQVDDVKIEFHPHSGRQPLRMKMVDFIHRHDNLDVHAELEHEPWHAFGSLDNFRFAEWALDAALNERQLKTIIELISRVRTGTSDLSFSSIDEYTGAWNVAQLSQPMYEKTIVSVPYRGIQHDFDIHSQPLLDYFLEQAAHPVLAKRAEWHAMRVSKWNGEKYVPMYEEPITGERAWELESSILSDGVPFFVEVYADKTELASFGDQKAYPVVAQWCALPHFIRHGKGLGAGRVIGFLPIIEKNAREDRKTGYTTFKNVVWHEGVWEMLKELAGASNLGRNHVCGDKFERILYFLILILAADYEEQCTMALARGLKSLFLCVVCDAPVGRLWDVTEPWNIRDPEKIKAIIRDSTLGITQKNEKTKHYGIRPTENMFWKFFNCNPHEALSFDRLHAFHGGLFGKHLLVMLQDLLEDTSREAQAKVDEQVAMVPRFSGLTHFTSVSQIKLTDGTKFEDLSKIIIHVSHNVIDEKTCPEGIQLLKTIRAYQVLDTWLSFDLHTEETVREVEKCIGALEVEIKALAKFFPDKVWQFIKAHSYAHSTRDIRKKGVTRNYNTKPNEKLHGRLKDAYQNQTNYKEVKSQIAKLEHRSLIVSGIRDQLNEQQAHEKSLAGTKEDRISPYRFGNHVLGSRQCPVTMSELELSRSKDSAFRRFRFRLEEFLTVFLLATGNPLPYERRVKLSQGHEVTEFCSIKLLFKSSVNMRGQKQILHVSDNFYGSRRRDTVLVHSDDNSFFVANLEFIFTCKLDSSGQIYPLALIHALDAPSGVTRRKDRTLELTRLRERKRDRCEFIPLESIVRGVLAVPAFDVEGDWMLVDVLDPDIRYRVHNGTGTMPVPPPPRREQRVDGILLEVDHYICLLWAYFLSVRATDVQFVLIPEPRCTIIRITAVLIDASGTAELCSVRSWDTSTAVPRVLLLAVCLKRFVSEYCPPQHIRTKNSQKFNTATPFSHLRRPLPAPPPQVEALHGSGVVRPPAHHLGLHAHLEGHLRRHVVGTSVCGMMIIGAVLDQLGKRTTLGITEGHRCIPPCLASHVTEASLFAIAARCTNGPSTPLLPTDLSPPPPPDERSDVLPTQHATVKIALPKKPPSLSGKSPVSIWAGKPFPPPAERPKLEERHSSQPQLVGDVCVAGDQPGGAGDVQLPQWQLNINS
ncbi:hypothetical protein NM688_g1786 [Phlebia brevispora]|uniref:Uncharacterized protein n=1 Tax=Phlebia brevispora TaxID=194682 RepID=A0ACC1TAM0_9APHY|nr:hypothetical protein NM688_g1786 [Phlebia brevispora]